MFRFPLVLIINKWFNFFSHSISINHSIAILLLLLNNARVFCGRCLLKSQSNYSIIGIDKAFNYQHFCLGHHINKFEQSALKLSTLHMIKKMHRVIENYNVFVDTNLIYECFCWKRITECANLNGFLGDMVILSIESVYVANT